MANFLNQLYTLKNLSKKLFLSNTVLFFGSILLGNAQMRIEIPYEKSVFQRNTNNLGNVHITGTLEQDADRVEGRLVPRYSNSGQATQWITIDNQIDGQSFTGSIQGGGGWYKLELRSIKNENILATRTVETVGIGEVFVISGQSNAQGDGASPNAPGASDERVLAFEPNYFNKSTYLYDNFPLALPINKFTNILSNTNIGPTGYSPWCYAELGDLLVKKLNVPVMFYNTALSGTSSENWVKSIGGEDTYHVRTTEKFQKFMPYHALKRTLNSLISIYGIRAILWHQGESDALIDVQEQTYFDNLRTIINETRNNTGEKIPWVVSRASRNNATNNNSIINAQNRAISMLENVWPGPATDDIQPLRPDGVHFENTNTIKGIDLLGQAWNSALTNQFFLQANPILPKGIAEIKYSCANQSEGNFKFDKIYKTYEWNTNSNSSTIRASTGEVSAILSDDFNNLVYTNKIIVPNIFPKDKPIISAINGLKVCVGKTVELKASESKYEVNWNTGKISNQLSVNQTGQYFSNYRSPQGCLSAKSNDLFPQFVDPPKKPTIQLVGSDGYECIGKSIQLKVDNVNNFDAVWSNGEKGNTLSISNQLPSPLKVTLFSNFDCPSPESDTLKYLFLQTPTTPNIEQEGPFFIKAIKKDNVQKFEWFKNNNYLTTLENERFFIQESGLYSVKGINSFTTSGSKTLVCKSGMSGLISVSKDLSHYGIAVYPNPVVDNRFNITSDAELVNVTVSIFNSIGQKIKVVYFPSILEPEEVLLDPTLPSDRYYVELKIKGLSRVFVLFKQ